MCGSTSYYYPDLDLLSSMFLCLPCCFFFLGLVFSVSYLLIYFIELCGVFFPQCCGCKIFHKLVDNLNLFHEMKCYVGSDFRYEGDAPFNYLENDEDGDDIFRL
jgi:hypothetical protein